MVASRCLNENVYSRTFRKRPPKMQRLGGRLREVVVVYKNRTTGGLFQEEVQTHLLYGRLFIACNIKVTTSVVPCCNLSFSYILSNIVHTENIEIRECVKWSLTRGKKQSKIITRQAQKVVAVACRRWSFTRGSNRKALTGKILAFWIGGRLWEVVAYERWSHVEVRL